MQATQTPDPLAQLKDIHPPAEVTVWPLDWGWWVIIGIFIMLLIGSGVWLYRRYRFYQPRREALAELRGVSAAQADWPARLNTLLKRTALSYFDPHTVAPLHGSAWTAFLRTTVASKYQARYDDGFTRLTRNLYTSTPDNRDFAHCQAACTGWVRHARLRALPSHEDTGAQHV